MKSLPVEIEIGKSYLADAENDVAEAVRLHTEAAAEILCAYIFTMNEALAIDVALAM